ncbi:MAG TPA: diacylglycerol kinase family protein [Candidatus Limnocylindrales bacterium]|nr:diacylglycerol kinase family protein [Candidatus Limnocylindrales bacterium]
MDKQHWVENVLGTMQIDPDEYSHKTSTSRAASFSYALGGWLYMLRRQKNTRIQAAVSMLVFLAAVLLHVDALGIAILIVTISVVWMAEFLNAAVEAAINLNTAEYHPMAKVAKDTAAAAVLLGAVASIFVGLLVLGPPLLARLGWIF